MKNNYQEFFLSSNPKEIEQAKKKRSALISLFPKRLGEKDETTYVLLNEEKPKQSVFFEDRTTGILNSGVASNESKAPKEQQDKQTLKVPGFNDGKSGTPLTNYNPEQKIFLAVCLTRSHKQTNVNMYMIPRLHRQQMTA